MSTTVLDPVDAAPADPPAASCAAPYTASHAACTGPPAWATWPGARACAERPGFAVAASVGYVAGVFLLAALATPWLWWLVRGAAALARAHARELAPALQALAARPLHRYLQRLLLVFALAGLGPLLRTLGLQGWRDLGLGRVRGRGAELRRGALLGALTVAAAAAVPLAAGARIWDPAATPSRIVTRVVTALAVAPLVAVLEELMFRGILEGGLRRNGGSRAVIAASSAFYAAVHFLTGAAAPPVVTWTSGFALLGRMLAGLGDAAALVPAFFTLWLVGGYFGRVYRRTGSLYASVGLHAGGIFVLQLYGLVTAAGPGADPNVWGTGRLVDGWAALVMLLAAGGVGRVVKGWTARYGVPRRAPGGLVWTEGVA